MRLRLFQVDAFTDRLFKGNPAAVVLLENELPDDVMQAIASENSTPATVFLMPQGDGYRIRWFTPQTELNLCGHGTLAASHVIYRHLGHAGPEIIFDSLSGQVTVERREKGYRMNFPAQPLAGCPVPDGMAEALGAAPTAVLAYVDYVAVFETEAEIRAMKPDFGKLAGLDMRGVIVTAPGDAVDFVSRFFDPKEGIDEDPVTGSAHCKLTPYWAERLGKKEMRARQLSKRGGDLRVTSQGERVLLEGSAVTFLEGEIEI